MLQQKMKRYEYPIKEGTKQHVGSYTIRADVKPLGLKGEKLVQMFSMNVLEEHEKLNEHEAW